MAVPITLGTFSKKIPTLSALAKPLLSRNCSLQPEFYGKQGQQPNFTKEFLEAHFEGSDPETLSDVTRSMALYTNFITPEEETTLLKEIETQFKRLRYEDSHWDDVSDFSVSGK